MSEIVRRIVTTFYRRMVVATKEVARDTQFVPPEIDADIRMLEARDLEAYVKFRRFQSLREVEERLAGGHLCFAAFRGATILHAGWAATTRTHIPYIQSDIILPANSFYIYDSYTDPVVRRSGLVRSRSSAMHVYFGGRGFAKSYGVVAYMNRVGRSILEPSGYRTIGMYGCVRLGPLHHTWAYPDSAEPLPLLAPHAG
jgi:hypothetical protein